MPSDIEKQSLEAHVEICSERYGYLEENMERIETRLTIIEQKLEQLTRNIIIAEQSKFKTMWAVGGTVIAVLLGVCGYLISYIISHLQFIP